MKEGKHTSYWVDMKNELELSIEDLTTKNKEMSSTIRQAKAMIRQQRLNQAFNDKFLKDNAYTKSQINFFIIIYFFLFFQVIYHQNRHQSQLLILIEVSLSI